MPAALPTALAVTPRTRSVAGGNPNGNLHTRTYHRTSIAITRRFRARKSIPAWIDYLWATYPRWFFEHAIVRIDPKDRKLISLPQQLGFLYYIVRPIRLVG